LENFNSAPASALRTHCVSLFLLLPDLIVADAEEGEIYERIVKICLSPPQFVSADPPVLVKVPIFSDQGQVVNFELSKTVEVGGEHVVQVTDFFLVGLEARRIEPVYDQPPPGAGPFAVHQGWATIEEF